MRTPPIGRRSDDLGRHTLSKEELTANWLPRYTGMPLENFGDYILGQCRPLLTGTVSPSSTSVSVQQTLQRLWTY